MAENSYEKPYSEETSKMSDDEVRAIIDAQYIRTTELLLSKRDE
jgi:cell division protease FtsH